ncbi:hypothetical protein F4780DRAFT_289333 [Xylariomycetidae sp. FL0641]|nr:hypothetical protein F4780DRAFT_289333 [Xylariomycetidae sp. FL0641]
MTMASFGRSLKPASYLSSVRRRSPGPNRGMSTSSENRSPLASPDSQQRSDRDVFFASAPRPSPPTVLMDNLSLGGSPRSREGYRRAGVEPDARSPSRVGSPLSASSPGSPPVPSRPIAIELPTTAKKDWKVNSAPVYTPPAPLSARGDLPGGYFPQHEDQNRVYRPHPFQLDATKARQKSIQRAASKETSSPDPLAAIPDVSAADFTTTTATTATTATTTPPAIMVDRRPSQQPLQLDVSRSGSSSRSTTPVASYMPTGAQDSPLPMGKYYPSNYEKRLDEKRRAQGSQPSSPETATPMLSGTKSEPRVPTVGKSPTMGHSRNESEAKRRLQQYQRDMIAQATLALNGGNVNAATLSSLRTIGFSSMSTPKPCKPRLAPLGSPGPVTPMELEGSEGGYLGAGGAAEAEIARAIQAEEERKRREGATSPAIDLGPSTC